MIWLDFETWCTTDISSGVYRYTADCEPMLFAYALDDEPARVVDFTAGEKIPAEVVRRLRDPNERLCAHNAMFDRQVMAKIIPETRDPKRWVDTLIKARLHSLPGGLGLLCDILGLPTDKAKEKDGRRLVLKFTKPNTAMRGGAYTKVRYTRETDPDDWARFVNYARLDVEAMRELNRRLPSWNSTAELWAQWHLDQRINDRGIHMDLALVAAAIETDASSKNRSRARVAELTGGALRSAAQRDAFIAFVAKTFGIELPDLTVNTIKRRIDDPEVPEALRTLLLERLETSKTSVQKYKAIERGISDDGRLRGCLQFAGATRTARFSGSLFQPQNLPRGTLSAEEVEVAIDIIKNKAAYICYRDVSPVLSSCIRGCLTAPDGRKLVIADYSNIEGRMLAWLAGEAWKVKAFEEFDAGKGADLYKLAYARAFDKSPDDVTKKERQIGKVMELGLGYQGGVAAFLTFAKVYGLDLDELAEHVYASVTPAVWGRSADSWTWAEKNKMTAGLTQKTWIACNALKNMWRDAHPNVTRLWQQCHDAGRMVADAIVNGGKQRVTVRGLVFDNIKGWLRIRLPSGRYLSYPATRPDTGIGSFTYMGMNQYSRQWSRLETYGGKIVENVVQAAARDLLVEAMQRVEAHGYETVLTVHDELVTEAPDSPEFSTKHLGQIMCQEVDWAKGLPLAAAGFEAYRYKKD